MNGRFDPSFELIKKVIEQRGAELAGLPGVLAVRSGFAACKGYMADPAVIVLVRRKVGLDLVPPGQVIPRDLDGVPVDVQQASVEELISLGLESSTEPQALEAIGDKVGIIDTRTPVEREEVQSAQEAERVDYPRPSFKLEEVNESMTVRIHSSPDNGWSELRQFLRGPIGHLSATIYEFEAQHVLEAIVKGLGETGTMAFVMQHSAVVDAWDNDDAYADLGAALGGRLSFAWAPVVSSRATTQGWFPSAYHEKVIVKDHASLWLSSGNWKESGQPEQDPFNPPADFDERAFLSQRNREWHVIAESKGLAEQFERFIDHDLATASEVQRPAASPQVSRPDVLMPSDPAALETDIVWFQPLIIEEERLRVLPLLSPDDFVEHITELVRSAKSRLYIQNQYLKPTNIARWKELNQLVRDFSQRPNVDFKVIIRDTKYWQSLEMMKEFGFDLSAVKKLKGTHTKGIIVDNSAVVVGSHNWSGQGFMQNRDASLIFQDPRVIQHFEKLFNYDYSRATWAHRVEPEVESRFAFGTEPTPPGMQRVRWSDYQE